MNYEAKPLRRFLEEGKKDGKLPLLPYSSRRRKRESFGSFLIFMLLEMNRDSSLMLKWSWLRLMLLWMLWFTLFSWGFLNGKSLCVEKGENLWLCFRMVHCSNSCFYFKFMMFNCLLERPISPQASMGFKVWKIEAIVGRLCQNFYKNCAENYSNINKL